MAVPWTSEIGLVEADASLWADPVRRDHIHEGSRGHVSSRAASSVNQDGSVFVAEFVLGGRPVRLSPAGDP
jgi:hypothetical protein